MLFGITAILILIILSGFFSGSETALTATSKARMAALEKQGRKRAKLINRLHKKREELISTILLGNNLVNILASSIATTLILQWFDDGVGVLIATLLMTFLILIFAEVLPKTYAIYHADKIALQIGPIIAGLIWLLKPFTKLIGIFVNALLKLLGSKHKFSEYLSHEDEIRGAIELHQSDEKDDAEQERKMLHSILDLADITVSEVMTHRSKLFTIDGSLPIKEIIKEASNSPYTRIPIWKNTQDNIIGVLHVRNILKSYQSKQANLEHLKLEDLMNKPWFIPETTALLDQLQTFKARGQHFSIVVDEYGALLGIITLEDILEEIVGEITDEHDIQTKGIRLSKDGTYLINGTVTIRDINRELDWDLPDEDASTLAGLIIHETQDIPNIGESFTFYKTKFKIMNRKKNQLLLIQARKL